MVTIGAGWKTGTAVYLAITIPVLSGLIAGMINNCATLSKGYSLILKIFALSFGLFFYGGVLGIALYDDLSAIPVMPISGLLLASFTLIGYAIANWRDILAFLFGINKN